MSYSTVQEQEVDARPSTSDEPNNARLKQEMTPMLLRLSRLVPTVPTVRYFVDIAGLVEPKVATIHAVCLRDMDTGWVCDAVMPWEIRKWAALDLHSTWPVRNDFKAVEWDAVKPYLTGAKSMVVRTTENGSFLEFAND